MSGTLRGNIAALAERRQREADAAPLRDRIARRVARIAGSIGFVLVHLVIAGAWLAINGRLLPGIAPFDPSLVILGTTASVEALFLSTFVLISQNRMAAAADRRADLDLHINLLAEHELTRLAVLIEAIARRLDVRSDADADLAEVKRDVEPAAVLDALQREERDRGTE